MANRANPASGCLILFSIPFTFAGLFFAVVSYRSMNDPHFQNPKVGIVVGSVIAFIGLLIMAAGFQVVKGAKRIAAAQTAYPDQPWMWREDWARSQVAGGSGRSIVLTWIFAAFWNAISWVSVSLAILHPQPSRPRAPYLLLAIFPTVGVGLLCWAVLLTVRRMRFGKSILQLQTLPVSLGRSLQGSIEARLPYPLPHGIQMRVSCINRVTSGSGNSRSTWDHILWQDTKTIPPEQVMAGPTGTAIPVRFDIPRDQPATYTTSPNNQILWLLRAEADMPGADFCDEFELPVFETRESPSVTEWATKEEAEERSHPPTPPVRPTVQISPAAEGGTQFYFPAARNLSSAMGVTFFALMFGAVDVALFYFQAHFRVLIIFGLFFGVFVLLLSLISLNLWFGTARIVAGANGVSLHSNLMGMGGSKKWSGSEIHAVYPKITMQTGNGGKGVVYYTITIKDVGGREYSLGNALRDHNEAEWICAQIRQLANPHAKSAAV